MKTLRYIVLCLMLFSSVGCMAKKNTPLENPIDITVENEKAEAQVHTVSSREDKEEYKAKADAPKALSELLEMESPLHFNESEVSALRPKAIREAAQLVAIQKAMKWRYEQLIEETERYAYLLDTGFNFSPLLMVNDEDIMVMPPVITQANTGMRVENQNLVTTAKSTYEIIENAKYLSTIPNWRIYMMANAFPQAEEPSLAVLPRNAEERIIWQEAIYEAWEQGLQQANELYIVNLNKLVRDYRGISLYHLLVAKSHLSEFSMSSSPATTNIDGDKLFLEQKVFRITNPSRFQIIE